ncbi:hypothetical protein ACN28S_64075 [Cystobacter fuscus]
MGALGAKLTGAGGAVIGLFHETGPVVHELTRLGIRCFDSQLAGPRAGSSAARRRASRRTHQPGPSGPRWRVPYCSRATRATCR